VQRAVAVHHQRRTVQAVGVVSAAAVEAVRLRQRKVADAPDVRGVVVGVDEHGGGGELGDRQERPASLTQGQDRQRGGGGVV
jgi:hypothetical protein